MANNLALMWIGMEATTIVSALLIGLGFRKRPLAVEAAWKYIVLCTVGITFALLGHVHHLLRLDGDRWAPKAR